VAGAKAASTPSSSSSPASTLCSSSSSSSSSPSAAAAAQHEQREQQFPWHDAGKYEPRENAAPGCYLPVVFEDAVTGRPALRSMVWGLVPAHTRLSGGGGAAAAKPDHWRLFNARSERVLLGEMYARQAGTRRGVVLLSGFYEWEQPDATQQRGPASKGALKQPHYLHDASGAPIRLAALFDCWRPGGKGEGAEAGGEEEQELWTVTLLTAATPAAHPMAGLHHRVPLMLDAEEAAAWIAREPPPPQQQQQQQQQGGPAADAADATAAAVTGLPVWVAMLRRPPHSPCGFADVRVHPRMNRLSYQGGDVAAPWEPPRATPITSFFKHQPSPKKKKQKLERGAEGGGGGQAAAESVVEPVVEPVVAAAPVPPACPARAQGEEAEAEAAGGDGAVGAADEACARARLAAAPALAVVPVATTWACSACTFVNTSAIALVCEVCHSERR
jgi:putative SOS response-associated peptidase YedK